MTKFKLGGPAFAAALLACVSVPLSGAQAVTITNGSFENGAINPGSFVTLNSIDATSITGWRVSTGSVDYIGSYWTASDGARSVDLNGLNAGTIEQTITGLTVGNTYRVSFDLAGNPDNGPATKTLDVKVNLDSNNFNFTVPSGATHANLGWLTQAFIFTADNTSAVLAFQSTTGGDPGQLPAYGPAIDNVSISQVPLPASLPLLLSGLGGLGAACYGKKRRKTA
jgi:choice-of-anchor C domain-containing protein